MHVEPDESNVAQARCALGDAECFIERDTELLSLFARANVLVSRVDRDLGIHPDRHRRTHRPVGGEPIDERELQIRFDVDKEDTGIERLRKLLLGLSHSTKDDVRARESGALCAKQLAPGDHLGPRAHLAQQPQNGTVRVGL